MNKFVTWLIGGVIALVVTIALILQFAHKLENQNLAIVQSMTGEVEVRMRPGWWIQISPTITEYNKAGMYRLNASDNDSLKIQFNNKSTATLNAAIGYRIDGASNEQLIALHQQVEGNDEKIWQMVLTALNTAAQSITTKYDPSSVIGGEKFEPMVREIYAAIMHNPELLKHGIDVNYFAVDGRPLPDKDTEAQFNKQKEADLARRLAEAEKIRLEAETIKTQANYEREIAEYKGKADAETAKLVTEAERQAKLAKIEAQKKVDVETLAKQEMLVKATKEKEVAEIEVEKQKQVAKIEAEKLREVAEIAKLTEAERLEAVRLQAEQRIAEANAKKVAIELSGAITEVQQAQIDLERQIAQYKWENIGKGISGLKLPQMMTIGGANGNTGTNVAPLDQLIQTMTLEKLNNVANVQPTM